MVRRTGALLAVVVAAAAASASCSTDAGPSAPPPSRVPATASASAAVPTVSSAAPNRSAQTAGRTLVTPPAGRAPTAAFAVEERRLTFSRGKARPLVTTVWYPARSEGGPFPLVLFSHGLMSEPSAYASILIAWARAGFVVAAPAYPHTSYGVPDFDALDVINQPADASYVITQMVALNTRAGDPLRGRIDTARIAAAGHSAGGITTIGMFSGNRDDRLVAGIVLAGERVLSVPFSGPPAPMLFVHGKLDDIITYAHGLAAFTAVPWSRALMSVTKGGHVAITKDFAPVIATTTDFLRWSLYGDAAAKARLRSDATGRGVATFTDEL